MDTVDMHATPIAVASALLSAGLLGLTWAAARADDVATVVQSTGLPSSIPQGLDGITFPAAIVLLVWALKGWTPTVEHRHTISLDDKTRRSLERAARIGAGHTVTDHGEDTP